MFFCIVSVNIYLTIKAAQIKIGRQVAIDLYLPGDIYFIISQGNYEFRNKNGIADMLSDSMSISRVSDFTEISSIMLNSNLKDKD